MAKLKSSEIVVSKNLEPGVYKNVVLSAIKTQVIKEKWNVLNFTFKSKEGIFTHSIFDPTSTVASEEQRIKLEANSIEEASTILKEEKIKQAAQEVMYFAEKITDSEVELDVELNEDFDWTQFCIDAQNLFPTVYNNVELYICLTGNVWKGKARIQFPKFFGYIERMDSDIIPKLSTYDLAANKKYFAAVSSIGGTDTDKEVENDSGASQFLANFSDLENTKDEELEKVDNPVVGDAAGLLLGFDDEEEEELSL